MKRLVPILLLFLSVQVIAQKTIALYQAEITNNTSYQMKEICTVKDGIITGYKNVSVPTLAVYIPDSKIATGAAVIICPGGGYKTESYRLEGTIIAEAFMQRGIAAFVLKYRLPSDSIMKDKTIGPLQDAQQAIKIVRQQCSEWNINPNKIGIMGFSAGGHLAATAGTHFDISYIPNNEDISLRPDYMVLVYPVISMKNGLAHQGSMEKLLGKNPTASQIDFFSNEQHVNKNTPPTWLTHTGDDSVVSVENSIRFYQELVRNKVHAEMHLYPSGNHGFVLKMPTSEWMQSLFDWLKRSQVI